MDSKLFQGLNDPQREAVAHKDGPLLILAGPGSGKTRVVTHRIAYLLEQDVKPWNIVALTFTNKAADEMRERLAQLAPESRVWIGTFHRFCARLLRAHIEKVGLEPNFTIYDTDESKRLIDGLVDKRDLPVGCDAAKILSAISWAKNGLILPGDYTAAPGHELGRCVEKVYPEYQRALRAANAVDFDDLLLHTAFLLKNHEEVRARLDDQFRYILVDEYQDTNLVQYAIARALSRDYPNLAVTGDPDQSIYGWRGANIRNILEFEKDFQNATVIRLEENYRSYSAILELASELIKKNKQRKEKRLFTRKGGGIKPRLLSCSDQIDEADLIASEIASEVAGGKRSPGDYAVFFRMNALSRNLERAFRQRGVPFTLVRGLEFFNRKEIKDILSYFQLIYNPSDTVSFQRVINLPARGIGRVTLTRIADFAAAGGISLFEAAERIGEISGISLRTKKAVTGFTSLIRRLAAAAPDSDMETLLSLLLEETRYAASFASNSEEDKQRLANVQELLSEVREFDKMFDEEEENSAADEIPFWDDDSPTSDRLGRFLEQAALTSDVDAYDQSDRVSLMTLHAAKGLEFPVVYIVALEDNILPHERSKNHPKQLEEERRLLFVGITRAKEELRISHTAYREFRGSYVSTILSRFVYDMPTHLLDIRDSSSLKRELTPPEPADDVQQGEQLLSDYLNQLDEEECEENAFGEPAPARKPKRSKGPRVIRSEDGVTVEANEYCEPEPEECSEMIFDDDGNLVPASKARKPRKAASAPRQSEVRLGVDLDANAGESPKKGGLSWQKTETEPKTGSLLRHPDYGVGFVKKVFGPTGARILHVEFLSGVGLVDLPLSDPKIRYLGKK